jgi:hypothetical protein
MCRLRRIVCCVISGVLLPHVALAWGSVAPSETHQHILREAFARLRKDPAFSVDKFPALDEIMVHEGVQWTQLGLIGNGPDAAGKSRYAEHYYNPLTGLGDGPKSTARYYGYLFRAVTGGKAEGAAKSAAWSAHFLADMCVPYHVVGTTRAEAERIVSTQRAKHPGVIYLGHNVTGSDKLVFKWVSPIEAGKVNFVQPITRFLEKTEPSEADWFDPWYFNGNTETFMIKTSSHVAWEATPSHVSLELHNAASSWTNASPTFKDPWVGQARQVEALAKTSAKATQKALEALYSKPDPGIQRAIQAVYTMWRSSFSGMRPTLAYSRNSDGTYQVSASIENNAADPVKNLKFRLAITNGSAKEAAKPKPVTTVKNGATALVKTWTVRPAKTDALCGLNLEVIGSYKSPDLQYAKVERHFMPDGAKPPEPPAASKPVTPPPKARLVGTAQTAVYDPYKGKGDSIRVAISNVANWKANDVSGWRNNGTTFTADANGDDTIAINGTLTTLPWSYFDFNNSIVIKVDGQEVLNQKPPIKKEGGSATFSFTFDPKKYPKAGGISVSVSSTGGNPDFSTHYVTGQIHLVR